MDVVATICSFLPLSDMKTCRLVSKMWDAGATLILKNETMLHLNFNLTPTETQRNQRFVAEMAQSAFMNPPNLQIDLGGAPESEEYNEFAFAQSVALFKKFTLIRRLKLRGGITQAWQDAMVEAIFLNIHDNVAHLELDLRYYLQKTTPTLEFCQGKKFMNLKRLDFLYGIPSKIWGRRISAFPNLEELSVDAKSLKHEEVRGLKHLTKLSISSIEGKREWDSLMQLNQPLKKLSLINIQPDWWDDEDGRIHFDGHTLLAKHHNTLEYLTLELCPISQYPTKNIIWQFPNCPNLKRLELCLPQHSPYQPNNKFDIRFDPVGLNLSTAFPQLREVGLTFMGKWGGEWPRYLDPLFRYTGNKPPVCEGVTKFEVSYKPEYRRFFKASQISEIGGNVNLGFYRFQEIFPNADNKFMQDLKQYFGRQGI